ncbi:MAG TPA: GAF domain-containing sensor histidine kinase [Chloroflexota bacterium]|nr:GAF domain-containing sensor histidine kinase [Chloroflexota bacterium]
MNVKNLRLITIVLPIAYILAIELFSLFVLLPVTGRNAVLRLLMIFGLLVVGSVPFSFWVFAAIDRRMTDLADANAEIERRNRELRATNTAITSISHALNLSEVLQTIADVARELASSRYAALGVADESGRILQFITSGITSEQRAAIGPLPEGHGLLAALIHEAQPLRIPNIAKDPRSHGFPPNHPPMTNLLGVPIFLHGKPVGDLYLTDKIGAAEFTQEDQDLIMLLANHAAIAIENARLYEEAEESRERLQTLNTTLEERVAERTREIERYSKDLTTRVLRAQEEERKRIARELHDDTAQSLSTLLINLDVIQPEIPETDGILRSGFDRVRAIAQRTLDATRALSHDLRPTILDDFGLIAALRWYAEEYSRTFGIPVTVRSDSIPPGTLSPEAELALFRIAQEALTNTGKYARATRADVKMTIDGEMATLTVEDDGQGFDVDGRTGPTRHGGLGLYGMVERAQLLGGTLHLASQVGQGTCVTAVIPIVAVDSAVGAAEA